LKEYLKVLKKNFLFITMDKQPKLITYKDFITYRKKPFYYVKDIKYTLSKHNINHKGLKKDALIGLLNSLYTNLQKHEKHLDSILLIQKNFREFRKNKMEKFKGPGNFIKELCHNQEDFYSFESVDIVPNEYFFSYKNSDNFIYWFDIRSLTSLINNNENGKEILNPYTRQIIPKSIIKIYNKRINLLKKNNINIYHEQDKLTPEQEFKARVLGIFQKIDLLNAMAGGTDPNWFHNLNLPKLKEYYKQLEDVWNYRAQLTKTKQLEIVPNRQMFKIPIPVIQNYNITKKRDLQNIILDEIDALISSSNIEENKSLGCYYVLISFVETSHECAIAMPWLSQGI